MAALLLRQEIKVNTDIRLAVGFWQHPKVYRMEKAIGLRGIRSLQILWCWCAQNRPDGRLNDLTAEEIEFVANWRGKKGAFIAACLGNWLDLREDGYHLHEWAEHNPWQAQAQERSEARKEAARKAANARWGNRQDNGQGTLDGFDSCDADADAYANGCERIADAYANGCDGAMPPIPIPSPIPSKSMNGEREGASGPQASPGTNDAPPEPPLPDLPPDLPADSPDLPADSPDQGGLPCEESSLEFMQLRQWWDGNMRSEGPKAGWQEYLAVKKIRDGTGKSIWPGFIFICEDADKRKQAGVWSQGYEPGLARYLKDRTWLAAVKPRARPQPRAASLKDQRSLEREQMAQALLEYEKESGSIL